jgi:hypothetical protein
LNISDLLDRSVPLLRRHLEGRVSALEAKIEELKAPTDVKEAIKEITQQYSFADLGDFISTFRDSLHDAHQYSRGLTQHLDEVERKGENLSNRVAGNRLLFDQVQEALHRRIDTLNERVEGLQKGLSENVNSEIYRIVKAEVVRLEATFSQKLQQNQCYNEEQKNATSRAVHSLNDYLAKVNENKPISLVEVRQIAKEEAERVKPSSSAPAASGTAPANAEARLAALEAWATNTGNMLGIPFKKA